MKMFLMMTSFPKFLDNHPMKEFCHLGGCCARKSSVMFLVCGVCGQEGSTRVWQG
jgi:hypothetical protein